MTQSRFVNDLSLEALAPYRELKKPRGRQGPVVVEGVTAITRLLQAGHPVLSVLTTPDALLRLDPLLAPHVPRWVAPAETLREVVGFAFHRGALALAARPVVPFMQHPRTLIVGEHLADPANVGALIRNACALGADGVWLDEASADPFSRRAIRAAMGWCFVMPVLQTPLLLALQQLQVHQPHMRLVAASCHADAVALDDFAFAPQCALLVGNEGAGLSDALLQQAHHHVRIPMQAEVDSLNVAAATAILLYARRSRRLT